MNIRSTAVAVVLVVCAGPLASCKKKDTAAKPGAASHEEAPPTNRIDIPDTVRSNLGVTFAKVMPRAVAATTRYPGRFEPAPGARREHRAPTEGRVTLRVKPFDRVAAGDELFRLDAPRLRELRRTEAELAATRGEAAAKLSGLPAFRQAHRAHEAALRTAVDLWRQRVVDLEDLAKNGVGRMEELAAARAESASAESAFAETLEKDADLGARETELTATVAGCDARLALLRLELSALTSGFHETAASRPAGGPTSGPDAVVVRATAAGVVELVAATEGAWASTGELVARTLDPAALVLRATASQSDLPRLIGPVDARIAAATGGAAAGSWPSLAATLSVEPFAAAEERSVGLIATPLTPPPPWARPGVAAALEVAPGGAEPELSVPRVCVMRDGLRHVIFRRDPANKDRAIRVEAELGADDGRFVVLKSGVREGDEVVQDGAYLLMLSSSGSAAKGGHFHSDGTFHAGEDK